VRSGAGGCGGSGTFVRAALAPLSAESIWDAASPVACSEGLRGGRLRRLRWFDEDWFDEDGEEDCAAVWPLAA
jgi:hypothetical protein